ncbi:MAG: hypothetical protein K0S32_701 [Bacteroidetes bacterium]|jgi:hypothetical protein|nr:hypothetical protein [Bacteroidota bacterium]
MVYGLKLKPANYSGLTKAFGSDVYLSYQSGIDELTSNEMVLNSNTFGETTDQAKGLSANSSLKESMLATDNSPVSINKVGTSRQVHLGSRVSFKSVSAIMNKISDGTSVQKGVDVTQYNPDGSEILVFMITMGIWKVWRLGRRDMRQC